MRARQAWHSSPPHLPGPTQTAAGPPPTPSPGCQNLSASLPLCSCPGAPGPSLLAPPGGYPALPSATRWVRGAASPGSAWARLLCPSCGALPSRGCSSSCQPPCRASLRPPPMCPSPGHGDRGGCPSLRTHKWAPSGPVSPALSQPMFRRLGRRRGAGSAQGGPRRGEELPPAPLQCQRGAHEQINLMAGPRHQSCPSSHPCAVGGLGVAPCPPQTLGCSPPLLGCSALPCAPPLPPVPSCPPRLLLRPLV